MGCLSTQKMIKRVNMGKGPFFNPPILRGTFEGFDPPSKKGLFMGGTPPQQYLGTQDRRDFSGGGPPLKKLIKKRRTKIAKNGHFLAPPPPDHVKIESAMCFSACFLYSIICLTQKTSIYDNFSNCVPFFPRPPGKK